MVDQGKDYLLIVNTNDPDEGSILREEEEEEGDEEERERATGAPSVSDAEGTLEHDNGTSKKTDEQASEWHVCPPL